MRTHTLIPTKTPHCKALQELTKPPSHLGLRELKIFLQAPYVQLDQQTDSAPRAETTRSENPTGQPWDCHALPGGAVKPGGSAALPHSRNKKLSMCEALSFQAN